jgi:hypothetical protein
MSIVTTAPVSAEWCHELEASGSDTTSQSRNQTLSKSFLNTRILVAATQMHPKTVFTTTAPGECLGSFFRGKPLISEI